MAKTKQIMLHVPPDFAERIPLTPLSTSCGQVLAGRARQYRTIIRTANCMTSRRSRERWKYKKSPAETGLFRSRSYYWRVIIA